MLVRYREARQIGDGLVRDALHALGSEVDAPAGATVVVNPTARARRGVVEGIVPGSGPCHFVGPDGAELATQAIGELRGEGYNTMVTGQKVRWVLDLMRGTEFAGRQITSYEIIETSEFHDVVLQEAGPGEPRCDLTELKTQMLALGDDDRTMRFRLLITPHRHVLFDAGPVDGFGWSSYTVRDGAGPETAVRASEHTLENEHLRVHVEPTSGTYTLTTVDGISVAGLGRLVDGGDGGDTYNYSPPDIDRIVDRPDAVRIETIESGPGARPDPHRVGLHVAGWRDRRRPCLLGAFGCDRRSHGRDHARSAPRRTLPARRS